MWCRVFKLHIHSQPETKVYVEGALKAENTIFLFDKLNEEFNQNVYKELLTQIGLRIFLEVH